MKISYILKKTNDTDLFKHLGSSVKVTLGNAKLPNNEKISDVLFELDEEDSGVFNSAQEKQLFYMKMVNSTMHIDNPNYTYEYQKFWDSFRITINADVPLKLDLSFIKNSKGAKIYNKVKDYLTFLFLEKVRFNNMTSSLKIEKINEEERTKAKTKAVEFKTKLYANLQNDESVKTKVLPNLLYINYFVKTIEEAKIVYSEMIEKDPEPLIKFSSSTSTDTIYNNGVAFVNLLINMGYIDSDSAGFYQLKYGKDVKKIGSLMSEVVTSLNNVDNKPYMKEIGEKIGREYAIYQSFLKSILSGDSEASSKV